MEDVTHTSVAKLLEDIITPTEPREPQKQIEILPDKKESSFIDKKEDKQEEFLEEVPQEVLEESAELTIGMFDFVQTNIFRWRGKKKKEAKLIRLYGEKSLEKLESLLGEVDAGTDNSSDVHVIRNLNAEDYGMLRIEKAADEYFNGLALTEREKELLQRPLVAIMKKRGGEIPPEILLFMGFLQITGARGAELAML